MIAELSELVRHPSRALSSAPSPTRRHYSIGAIILTVLGIGLFYYMLPEIRRYLRVERM